LIANSDKTVREALDQGILQNETLAYFLARTYQFLLDVGINPSGIRFRQHRSNEMAHYANDCWDAEIETSYGWIEVAGHSDRSAFDLTKHQEKTKIELMAARPLKTPIQKQITHVVLDKQACGKEFKKDNAKVVGYFENLSADEKKEHAVKFAENGKTMVINAEGVEFSLTEKHLSFNEETVTI
jgi:glycyl-tRNA synthetase